jgi:hypothetical protein
MSIRCPIPISVHHRFLYERVVLYNDSELTVSTVSLFEIEIPESATTITEAVSL